MWENIKIVKSLDKNVFKYIFTNNNINKAVAETVVYKYPTFEERTVICCSTQSGCPVGCRFCGAGNFFIRSLTAKEIVAQIDHVMIDNNITKVKKPQIMFMSMGEPLLNLNNVKEAIKILSKKYPEWQLLLSTIAPNIGKDKYKEFNEFCKK